MIRYIMDKYNIRMIIVQFRGSGMGHSRKASQFRWLKCTKQQIHVYDAMHICKYLYYFFQFLM